MPTETILNLLWLCFSAVLLLACEVSGLRGGAARSCHSKRLAAIFLAAIFIFPCISASDDLWSFQNLRAIPESRRLLQSRLGETSESPAWRLAHFFDSLQTQAVSRAVTLAALFCFLGLVFVPNISTSRRSVVSGSGRAPPVIASHA